MSYTPGPWKVQKKSFDHYPVYRETSDDFTFICSCNSLQDTHLIAAAPELLEAAKDAKKLLEPELVEPGRTVFWKLVSAIAKAEGKS